MPLVSIVKSGNFAVRGPFGKNKCGTDTVRVIQYRVEISCNSDNLDDKKFVIHNQRIHQWFVDRYSHAALQESCEMIGLEFLKWIDNYFSNASRNIYAAKCSISGTPNTWITAQYKVGESYNESV